MPDEKNNLFFNITVMFTSGGYLLQLLVKQPRVQMLGN